VCFKNCLVFYFMLVLSLKNATQHRAKLHKFKTQTPQRLFCCDVLSNCFVRA